MSVSQGPVKGWLECENFSEIICAKLENLIRLSQKGSYSVAVAALQMWRMESSLTLNPDLIGVDNPEKDPHKVGNYL